MGNEVWISSDNEKCKDGKRLLKDPYSLIQEDSLPKHICYDAMRQSTEDWASTFLQYPPLEWWGVEFPLPVGKEAFSGFIEDFSRQGVEFLNALPFDGHEKAVFIAKFKINNAALTFFGLAEFTGTFDWYSGAVEYFKELGNPSKPKPLLKHRNPPEKDNYIDKYTIAGCKFVIIGDNPASREVANAVNKLRRWWKTFEGKNITGRPPGSHYLKSAEEIKIKWRKYLDECEDAFDGKRPTQQDFADYLHVSRRTLMETFDRLSLNWPPE